MAQITELPPEALQMLRDKVLSRVIVGNGCWTTTGDRNRDGYGVMIFRRRKLLLHRVSYMAFVGPIPAGKSVCHKCDNPPCANPHHLFVGTQADNARDMVAKGRANRAWGESAPGAKLTAGQVLDIRRLAEEGESQIALALRFGVKPLAIHDIVHRKSWRKL